jgi:hypothetical protein
MSISPSQAWGTSGGSPLEHGDTVHAGGTLFRVTIEGLPEPIVAIVDELPKSPPPHEPKPLEFSSKYYPSKVAEFTLAAKDSQLATVLNALTNCEFLADNKVTGCQLLCAVNTKRLGRRLATLAPSDSDLFSNAPEEIRETDSLAILPVPSPLQADVLSELGLAGRRNASFLVLSPQPLAEYLDSHKLVWGWYSRPNILHQQITLGSSVLAEKLVVGSEIILLFGSTPDSGLKLLVQKTRSDKLFGALQAILI